MRTSTLFRLAGAAWGFAAALIAAVLAAAAAFVGTWAFVLGDHNWPPIVSWFLGTIALLAAVAAFGLVMAVANAQSRRAERLPLLHARRQAIAWLASGVGAVFLLMLGGATWLAIERNATDREDALETRYRELASAVHAPTSVILEVAPTAITVTSTIDGRRAGRYSFTTRLTASIGKALLAEHTESIDLRPGAVTRTVVFDTPTALANYRRDLLAGGLGSVDQHLVAEVMLDPDLTADEESLARGHLPLLRTARGSTRVTVVAAPDGIRVVP